MKTWQKIVIKVGSSTLTQGSQRLSRRFMLELARQLATLHEAGKQVILVTSGAIVAGKESLKHPPTDRTLPYKQMFAAIGQVQLMQRWAELFSLFDVQVGQILLTREDFSHRKRYLNARDTLSCLLSHRVIPIINENDSVATKEIKVGDNDNLAALAANLIGADGLILLTDQQGLYTQDPRLHPEAKLIPVVKHIDQEIFKLAGGSSTSLGTGGMATKIQAAQSATQCGTPTIIACSALPNVLLRILDGEQLGTLFLSTITPRESRKRWLLSEKRQGSLQVDEGAAAKIAHQGASLLPSGIVKVNQTFERGAIIKILGPSDTLIAVGITNYDSQEIHQLIGHHSCCIEDILGYSYGPEVIHRTNMTRIKAQEDHHD